MRCAKCTILALHLHIGLFTEVLQQITPFEVLVGMDNCLELIGCHNALILGLFNLGFV